MHINNDGTSNSPKIKTINSFGIGNDDIEHCNFELDDDQR